MQPIRASDAPSHANIYCKKAAEEKDDTQMKPRPKRNQPRQAINPLDEPRLLSIKARYLKELALAFLGEFLSQVETLGTNRHLDIEQGISLSKEVRRFEIDLIKYALERTGGHQARAAALLGMKATTLNSKVKLYRLQPRLLRCVAGDESPLLDVSTRPRPILGGVIADDHGATTVN
jgi:DNA-binding NtrC family response regulator